MSGAFGYQRAGFRTKFAVAAGAAYTAKDKRHLAQACSLVLGLSQLGAYALQERYECGVASEEVPFTSPPPIN